MSPTSYRAAPPRGDHVTLPERCPPVNPSRATTPARATSRGAGAHAPGPAMPRQGFWVCAAILSLVSRALALVFSTPRSTLAPTVSLPSAFRAASAWSSADSFLSPLTLALILSFASTVFSLALSHASEVVSLVLSQASEVFSLTVSLASTALSFSVLLSSALMAGMALRLLPSATARAAVASLYMAGPPRGWWVAKPTPAAEAASGLQQLLGNLLHIGRVDLSLVG